MDERYGSPSRRNDLSIDKSHRSPTLVHPIVLCYSSLVSVGKLSKFRFSRLDRSISSREDQTFENAIASFDGHFHRKLRAIADR